MSHPDPLFDPDNAYEDNMNYADDVDASNYDDYNDFYEDEEDTTDETWTDDYDDSMDGDHESGLASAGWGTDEDYGFYSDNTDYGDDGY
jgi:hypothetical protein